jgi:hypothetical protein
MTQDAPNGDGFRPGPSDPPVSVRGADAPLQLYLVMGSTGEYSDRSEWPVCVFEAADAAEAYVEVLQVERLKLGEAVGWDAEQRVEEDGITFTVVYTTDLRALLSSAEAREEATDAAERDRDIWCEIAEERLAALQAAETRAQQAEARVEEVSAALRTLHNNITTAWPSLAELGPLQAARQALQQGEGNV